MRRPVDLSLVYDYRIRTISALQGAIADAPQVEAFESAIASLRSAAENLGDGLARARYGEFAILLDAYLLLTRWAAAVRGAEIDADRYARAARQRIADFLTGRDGSNANDAALVAAARRLAAVNAVGEVAGAARILLTVPLPLPLYGESPRFRPAEETAPPARPTITVAFLSFTLHDTPFGNPQVLEPELLHDLSVEVRVSQWPATAETLVLDVATVEPPSAYELPSFAFPKPPGTGPYLLRGTGRMALKMRQAVLSRPLDFAYRARFVPRVEGVDVRVEGQRHLRVQGYDSERQPLTGYAQLDPVIFRIRAEARAVPGIRDSELDDFLRILAAVANIAGQALQGNLFSGVSDERAFQKALRGLLRQHPAIGSELEEHPHAAGGVTDLSFHGIPLELKCVADKPVHVDDVEPFLPQAAAYVTGADRRMGLLIVLDCSAKTVAPGSAANDIFLRERPPETGGSLPVLIGVVILRGNLPRPSGL